MTTIVFLATVPDEVPGAALVHGVGINAGVSGASPEAWGKQVSLVARQVSWASALWASPRNHFQKMQTPGPTQDELDQIAREYEPEMCINKHPEIFRCLRNTGMKKTPALVEGERRTMHLRMTNLIY